MSSTPRHYVALVDNDESVCRSVGRLLRAAGFEAVTYGSAEDFLDDTKHPQFDCLLLDIQLGGMSGIELNQRLTADGASTPVIYLTASHDPETREQALRTPCVAYFRKSEPADSLLEAIRKSVSEERGSNHSSCESELSSSDSNHKNFQ